jgi:hypothetical protein
LDWSAADQYHRLALTRDSLRFYASINEVRCTEEISMTNTGDSSGAFNENLLTLRLVWPQWQGAGVESIRELFSEVPFEEARRGYAVRAAVLNAVLPAHTGPTAHVPVESGDLGLGKQDGIEAKEAVVAQLARALEVIGRYLGPKDLRCEGNRISDLWSLGASAKIFRDRSSFCHSPRYLVKFRSHADARLCG